MGFSCDREQVDELLEKATTALLSLLEACEGPELPRQMLAELSAEALGRALQRMTRRFRAKSAEVCGTPTPASGGEGQRVFGGLRRSEA